MRLTTYTDYSLRVLIFLGAHTDNLVTIQEISDAYSISKNHLTKIVFALGKAGFITTVRGKGGGIKLARPAADIRLSDVVQQMEPDFKMVECFDKKTSKCRIETACSLNGIINEALSAFHNVLAKYTLADAITSEDAIVSLVKLSMLTSPSATVN